MRVQIRDRWQRYFDFGRGHFDILHRTRAFGPTKRVLILDVYRKSHAEHFCGLWIVADDEALRMLASTTNAASSAVKSVRTAIAWAMINDPPFATLNLPVICESSRESGTQRVGINRLGELVRRKTRSSRGLERATSIRLGRCHRADILSLEQYRSGENPAPATKEVYRT